jgi:hypothetical protein
MKSRSQQAGKRACSSTFARQAPFLPAHATHARALCSRSALVLTPAIPPRADPSLPIGARTSHYRTTLPRTPWPCSSGTRPAFLLRSSCATGSRRSLSRRCTTSSGNGASTGRGQGHREPG